VLRSLRVDVSRSGTPAVSERVDAELLERARALAADRYGPEYLAATTRRIAARYPELTSSEAFAEAEQLVDALRDAAEKAEISEWKAAAARRELAEYERGHADRVRQREQLQAEIRRVRSRVRWVEAELRRLTGERATAAVQQGRSESRPGRSPARRGGDSGDPERPADPDVAPPGGASRRGGAAA
jgi:hypothetical protein